MPPIRSSSISLGTTEAMMKPSELTTQAPTISGELVRRPRRTSLTLSLFVLIDAPWLGLACWRTRSCRRLRLTWYVRLSGSSAQARSHSTSADA